MLEFMDYVQQAFYNTTHWDRENSYSQLTATARGKSQQLRAFLNAHAN